MPTFSPECLRIAQLYERSPDDVAILMELHGVTSLPLCRTPYDGYGAFVSDLTATVNTEPSRTQQQFTEQSDPNWIINRHAAGQDVSLFLTASTPMTGDFTDSPDSLQDALNTGIQARQEFSTLPESIRAQFGNNPLKFIDFAMDPSNAGKLVEMGLVTPPKADTSPAAASSPAAKEGGGEGA